MKRVVLDCDGLLSDFVGSVLSDAFEITGIRYERDQFPDWDIFGPLSKLHPGLKAELYDRIQEPGWCFSLNILPGAEAALDRLALLEHQGAIELFVATSPWDHSQTWMHERTRWLVECGIRRSNVIHAAHKYVIAGDLFMDDKPSHVQSWQAMNTGLALLWDTPHNRAVDCPQRITSWERFFVELDSVLSL